MTYSVLFRLILIAATLSLGACVNTSPHSTTVPTPQKTDSPSQWKMQAKLGIRSEEDSGSVTLVWQQNHNNYQIHVSAPLGQGTALIAGNDRHIMIERPQENLIASNQPNQLIQDTFGWPLPLTLLPFWAKGVIAPDQDSQNTVYDENGSLRQLSQAGWDLSFSRYKLVNGWNLPHRIVAEREEGSEGTPKNVKLTLIIRSWDSVDNKALTQQSLLGLAQLTYSFDFTLASNPL